MARTPIPSSSELWQKHVHLYITVFSVALENLASISCDTSDEDKISEELCPILNQVCFQKNKVSDCEVRTPDWEKPIQPITDMELKGGKKSKIPDFTCKLTNTLAASPEEHEVSLHVECKRLGNRTSPSWKLNKNYVTNGIMRFDSKTHKYGMRADSGMMIGYIISMSPQNILNEVNTHFKQNCPNDPEITFKFNEKKVQRCQHKLNRNNVKPGKFELTHLWVELKNQQNNRLCEVVEKSVYRF